MNKYYNEKGDERFAFNSSDSFIRMYVLSLHQPEAHWLNTLPSAVFGVQTHTLICYISIHDNEMSNQQWKQE